MDGKEESLCTDGNSFLGLHSHYVYNGKPPDKAVTFLMAKNTAHTNQEIVQFSVSMLILNSERMVLLHLKYKILCA